MKQHSYAERLVNSCLFQSYLDGNISFILDIDVILEAEQHGCAGVKSGYCPTQSLAVTISNVHALNVGLGSEFKKQQMLVRDVEIVKHPYNGIVRSTEWLDFGHDAIKERFAPGIYFNAVKGSFDTLSRFPNGEFCGIGNLVGNNSADSAVPCKIKGGVQIMDGVSGDQGEFLQAGVNFWNLVLDRLNSSVRLTLDCHSVGIFERENSGVHIRDVFFGPFDFESGVPVKCAHADSILHSP
ncbi:MAG: hypothetical protein WBE86_11550 [Candidatus Acidiferrales bacterium]